MGKHYDLCVWRNLFLFYLDVDDAAEITEAAATTTVKPKNFVEKGLENIYKQRKNPYHLDSGLPAG